jgi:enoyl-CoA hydratase/carnithine racemase
MSNAGSVRVEHAGPVATIVFDRPEAHNALTMTMYQAFAEACRMLGTDKGLRAVVLRGTGGKAFVAGTDIARFIDFASGDDGIAYEREMEAHIQALLAIPVPTIAVIEGLAVGGGLSIAGACDIRIATAGSRFGVPIARTIGNCISMGNIARLVAAFGESRTKRMLLLGELIDAEEAREAGFLARLVQPGGLEEALSEVVGLVLGNAPLTLAASKAAIGRLRLAQPIPDDDDLIRRVYGSADFRAGVSAFLGKSKPDWRGE